MPENGLGSRFTSAAHSPGLAMWQTTLRWQAAMRAALAPHGLTHVQYVLLASLVWLHGADPVRPITQADLAGFATTDVMMTSQVLRALERLALIERRPHPGDGRARALVPTSAGIRTAQCATSDVEQADATFFAPLTDLTVFTGELARLAAHR